MRTVGLALVCVALGFGLRAWKSPAAVKAQTIEAVTEPDTPNRGTGRYQLVHIYYSAARQGTALFDPQTGHVFELAVETGTDKTVFQQVPFTFCVTAGCVGARGYSLRPVSISILDTTSPITGQLTDSIK